MSAETDYLRTELQNARLQLNNEALRLAAVDAIDKGLSLLQGRDELEEAGVVLPPMDAAIVGAVYDPINEAIDARNASGVAIKDKATILTELAALGS